MSLLLNVVFKSVMGNPPFKYLGVINDDGPDKDYLAYTTDEMLNKNAKFKIENAKGGLVHILSCSNNRYLARLSASEHWIVAKETKPVVDKASWSCTLFRIDINNKKIGTFHHVQSDTTVRLNTDCSEREFFLTIGSNPSLAKSLAIDLDDIVILPKYVAFRGSNDLFYQNYCTPKPGNDGYSGFSVKEIGDPNIVCETHYTSDGNFRVKGVSNEDNMFWRLDNAYDNLIVHDVGSPTDRTQMFSAVRIRDGTVALRCLGNNKLCQRGDAPSSCSIKDRLVATADGAVGDALLKVVEPVIKRTVYSVEFDLDNSRIYGITLLYSSEHEWKTPTNVQQTGTADGRIKTSKSKTFTNSVTVSGSVTTTFETGIPLIAKAEIEVSVSGSYTHEWSETTTEEQEVGHTFNVVVLPMKKTIARGTATRGLCDVPFSYVQKDYPACGGAPIVTKWYDGVFRGANAYGFTSDIRYEDLTPES